MAFSIPLQNDLANIDKSVALRSGFQFFHNPHKYKEKPDSALFKSKIRFLYFDRGSKNRTRIYGFGGRKLAPEKVRKIKAFLQYVCCGRNRGRNLFCGQIRHFAQSQIWASLTANTSFLFFIIAKYMFHLRPAFLLCLLTSIRTTSSYEISS